MNHLFALGDRVVVNVDLPAVPAGRFGTVVHLFVPGLYEVELDGEYWVRVFAGNHLAPALPKLVGEMSEYSS